MSNDKDIASLLLGAVDKKTAGERPLAALQDVIDQAIKALKELGADHRAEIELWADNALGVIVSGIPRPLVRAALQFIGPRLIDFALDSVFGDDGDNT